MNYYAKDGNRQTGRTHLMLINAIADALMGKKVLILTANFSQANHLKSRFIKLGGVSAAASVVICPVGHAEKLRGKEFDVVYRDHYADEFELKNAQAKITRLEAEKEDLRNHILKLNINLLKISNIAKQDIYDSDPFIFDKS